MKIKHWGKSLVAVMLAASLLAGCGGSEERKAKYLERGKAYLEEENYDKARIEFKNVLQIDPKTAEAYYLLGQIAERQQEWAKAFANYSKAVDLDPSHLQARGRLGRFYLLQAAAYKERGDTEAEKNALQKVQETLDAIFQRDPNNIDGLVIEASLAAHNGDTAGAITQLEEILKKAPDTDSAVVLLARLYEQQKEIDKAQRVIEEGVKAAPERLALRLQLAQFYARHGKVDEAVREMGNLIKQRPEGLAFRVSLASYLAQLNRPDEAEKILREAIAADPEDPQRHLVLAQFLMQRRGVEKAVDELKKAIEALPQEPDLWFGLVAVYQQGKQEDEAVSTLRQIIEKWGTEPPGLKARNQLARIYAARGEIEKVRALVKEVLEENPKDNDALLIKGRLAMQDKNYEEAIAAFRSILKDQPDSVEVLNLLAEAHLANGDVELAGDNLKKVVDIAPDNIEARLRLARYYKVRNNVEGMEEEVEAVLAKDPANVQALLLKSDILAAKKDVDGLIDTLEKIKVAAPDKADGWFRMGRLYKAQKKFAEAKKEFEEALKRAPDSLDLLAELTDIEVAMGEIDKAEARLKRIQQQKPDDATIYRMLGGIALARKNYPEAIRQFDEAYRRSPDVKLLTQLVNAEIAAKRSDAAERRLKTVLKEDPEHPAAHELLGLLYMQQRRFQEAAAEFEKQIERNPEGTMVYGQLANARLGAGDAKGAEEAYKQGLKRAPQDLRLLAGLAGFYERQADVDNAIATYERMLEVAPDNALATNNLAALLADHRTDKESLKRARELAEKFRGTGQPMFLDTLGWVYYRLGEYDKAVEVLKGVVEKAPKAGIFHYHLGMAYAGAGDKAAAREHLSKAVELGGFPELEDAKKALADLG